MKANSGRSMARAAIFIIYLLLIIGWLTAVPTAHAEAKFPVLKVGDETYTNVTVTTVTATDIYFTHANGIGNAKLKNLAPDLQKYFHFDGSKAADAEKKQREGNARYRAEVAAQKPVHPATSAAASARSAGSPEQADIVVPKLYARSVRGQRAPELAVQQWLTGAPDTKGKFVLVEFWATWCPACRASIPLLNSIHQKFQDKIVVIGVSDESEAEVRKHASPHIDYFEAIDPQRRMYRELGIHAIPHSILIDPQGIVRFEGMPAYLTDTGLQHLLTEYSD